jgi:hypothetical protein
MATAPNSVYLATVRRDEPPPISAFGGHQIYANAMRHCFAPPMNTDYSDERKKRDG